MMPPPLAFTPEISALLAAHAPTAIGVSGGKDSAASALATSAYLDTIGHAGPRILIHSDLGRVEWRDSLPSCQRLADRLDLELVVVRRAAGDLMDRWLTRWDNNVERYTNLLCVKIILPWSTPSMRFCTSELKDAVIASDLKKRFAGHAIISVNGIRREESAKRRVAPVSKVLNRLRGVQLGTSGMGWHSIIEWKKEEVFSYLAAMNCPLHEAYTVYQASRCSCVFCMLGTRAGHIAGTKCADNHDLYREQTELEIVSTFSFQEGAWLGDVAPHLLSSTTRDRLAVAKIKAQQRELVEARIPKHLLYTKGWPTCVPTYDEAVLLCEVRLEVGEIIGIPVNYTTPDTLIGRYEDLMEQARLKGKEQNEQAEEPETSSLIQLNNFARSAASEVAA
jgi:3'-phosphoadenosine 5'-phosphosulfate sulfotransferase (PAPS reductase)/FAD synthetase